MTVLSRGVKILHIFGSMNRGGAEMRTLEVMRYIDRSRYHLEFVALSGRPGTLDGQIRDLGSKVHYCPLGLTFPARFCRLLQQENIDAIHSHVHYFSGYLLRLGAHAEIPLRIAHFRNTQDDHSPSLRRRLQRALMRRWIDRHATHILAVGEGAMEASWGKDWPSDPRCQVVHNGLALSPFSGQPDRYGVRTEFGLPPDCTLYIHVGRMRKSKQKNHERLIFLFAEIFKRDPSARFLLVGQNEADAEQTIREQIETLGLARLTVLTGDRQDIPRLLQSSDLLVFPSLWEGLPGVVLEACASGIPVLASDLPGVREIAAYFPAVHYLPLTDSDAQWTDAAAAILAAHPRKILPSSDNIRRLFAQSPFTIECCAEKLCRIWQQALVTIQSDLVERRPFEPQIKIAS